MTLMSKITPLSSFWTIRYNVDPAYDKCTFTRSIRGPHFSVAPEVLLCLLNRTGDPVTCYEVLTPIHRHYSLYFDINLPCEREDSLDKILGFLRQFLGDETYFCVSQASRRDGVNFRIISPMVKASLRDMKAIAKAGASRGLGMNPEVYNENVQLMPCIFALSERPNCVPLIPLRVYEGLLSDHLIQAPFVNANFLNPAKIPRVISVNYVSDGGLIEDLVAIVKFERLAFYAVNSILSTIKFYGLRRLFDFNMKEYDSPCQKPNLDQLWEQIVCSSSCLTPDEVYQMMSQDEKNAAESVLRSHRLWVNGEARLIPSSRSDLSAEDTSASPKRITMTTQEFQLLDSIRCETRTPHFTH